ncbi:MAG: bacterial transcriptional activator domain-containing protein, partial [Actinomycetota bacterium]
MADPSGVELELSPIQRRIVHAISTATSPMTSNDLASTVWGPNRPDSAPASLHNHLSRLRRRAPGLVERDHDHYVLGSGVIRADDADAGAATASDPIEAATAAVHEDPHDEQARVDLVIALAEAGRSDEALAEIVAAGEALDAVGLEPGRRLTDLARRVGDGERDPERLRGAADERTEVSLAVGILGVDDVLTAVRAWLLADGDALLVVRGARGG